MTERTSSETSRSPGMPASPQDEKLLDVEDVAARLKVSVWGVRRWIGQGRLPHRRLGRCIRVHPDDLQEFLEQSKVSAGQGR